MRDDGFAGTITACDLGEARVQTIVLVLLGIVLIPFVIVGMAGALTWWDRRRARRNW
jgi:hypothetical protein